MSELEKELASSRRPPVEEDEPSAAEEGDELTQEAPEHEPNVSEGDQDDETCLDVMSPEVAKEPEWQSQSPANDPARELI